MPDFRTVLPAPKLLNLTSVRAEESTITLCARTPTSAAQCLMRGKRSAGDHPRCIRTLADLPWQGVSVGVHPRASGFFCDEVACQGGSGARNNARALCIVCLYRAPIKVYGRRCYNLPEEIFRIHKPKTLD
jgi:hypothetical protein